MLPRFDIDRILRAPTAGFAVEQLGSSRQGRPLFGARLGRGPLRVSLIAGCHADEPVGPAMLEHFAGYLAGLDRFDPLIEDVTWFLVPHVNPDGDRLNAAWSETLVPTVDHRGAADLGYQLLPYARHVVREAPGDDIEFGFPRQPGDTAARPETIAVATFLRQGAPFHVHGSLHGMAFAPGPWFLIEPTWIDRTAKLRNRLRRSTRDMGYSLLDWDRGGDKGFRRIDEGFSTRPDSEAMRRHFLQLGDGAMAARFRPSSMELVRSLGGDPFTFVSEMPLFLHPDASILADRRDDFRQWLAELAANPSPESAQQLADRAGIRPMPIRDQMRLQLAFVQEAIAAASPGPPLLSSE